MQSDAALQGVLVLADAIEDGEFAAFDDAQEANLVADPRLTVEMPDEDAGKEETDRAEYDR